MKTTYFNRDISWLSFNQRILDEAARPEVPLIERLRFLGIFSSNLDEFYRVRIPVLKALKKIAKKEEDLRAVHYDAFKQAQTLISSQQQVFGSVLGKLVEALSERDIELLHQRPIPEALHDEISQYFVSHLLVLLNVTKLKNIDDIFPLNNDLHLLVHTEVEGENRKLRVINIPSQIPRFYKTQLDHKEIIIYLDDIIRFGLWRLLAGEKILGTYSFKVTRDAELDLKDEYPGDLAEQIEQKLKKRDKGLATRVLYETGMPEDLLDSLLGKLDLKPDLSVEGGHYHNLKDLLSIPLSHPDLSYEPQPPALLKVPFDQPLSATIAVRDILIHPPYHCYDTIVRFFNEAAQDPQVREIYISLYRVASDSRIIQALIKAAINGKIVRVLLELKARFDEENNVKWAKQMKAAGIFITYSHVSLKVHAKIALVKSEIKGTTVYSGILSTGNFNERTAKIYTDHVLLTADQAMLAEMEKLFHHLFEKKEKQKLTFNDLLVSRFNLLNTFVELIDHEIQRAHQGEPASVTIKLNNLEEERLINKLYEASAAGVKVQLIIRSICRIVPGVPGLSEHITVRRIVDRCLEHGRVFIFGNGGAPKVFLGSADWMNRNIYHRIEVCFPVKDPLLKKELLQMIDLQLKDNIQAVELGKNLENLIVSLSDTAVRSQKQIYRLLNNIIA